MLRRAGFLSVTTALFLTWFALGLPEGLQPSQAAGRAQFIILPAETTLREKAEKVINSTLPKLQTLLGQSTLDLTTIYFATRQSEFDSLISSKFPDWGAAAAIPHRRLIVIKSPDRFRLNKTLDELLAHEISHIALADRTGLFVCPRWLDEGLAMFVSSEWTWSDNLAMSKASVFGQFLSLRDIEDVNLFGKGKAHIAYATSRQAVDYILTAYGDSAFRILIESIANGESVDSALMSSVGSDYGSFENEFNVYLAGRFNTGSLLTDTMYFWLGLAILLIIGGIVKMRSRKKYYQKWKAEEKLQSSDFDYGDPESPEKPDDEEPWRH